MSKRKPPLDPEYLVASIDRIDRTYFVSQDRENGHYVDDEAILDVTGKIEQISPRHKQFVGQPIDMSFACARRFRSNQDAENEPVLFQMNLRRGGCSFMAYLPADAFWALPTMIESEAVSRIEARFASARYGSGQLLSIYFATHAKLAELNARLTNETR